MKLQIATPFAVIEFEAENDKDAIKQITLWTQLPKACPICGAETYPSSHVAAGNEFFEMFCTGSPAHESNLGQYKAGGLYYKGASSWTIRRGEEPSPEPETKTPPAKTKQPTLAERIANGQSALKSIGVIVPNQLPDESEDQYLARLQRSYQRKQKP